jgi:hypothetical protein
MGTLSDLCSASPAPLLLLLLDGTPDRCHGGGPDSSQPDNLAAYEAHVVARLQSFLDRRRPSLALVGARTEWHPAPAPGGSVPDPCDWERADWDRSGIDAWTTANPKNSSVIVEPDLHSESARHSACCRRLGLVCDTNWYCPSDPMAPSALDADGAQAIVDFWYARLKQLLLGANFTCQ